MIGERPEWMLWAMFGLMAFIMLIPLLKALAPLPLPRSRPRRRIHLGRRQGLARRLGADLGKDTPQQLDARGKRVAVAVDGVMEQPGECGCFFVGQVKRHALEMGCLTNPRELRSTAQAEPRDSPPL